MSLKAQVAELVRAKRYADAIKLLEKSSDRGAAATIAKLKTRMAEEHPVRKARTLPGSDKFLQWLVIMVMIAPVLFLAGDAVNKYINRYPNHIEALCQTSFRDGWFDGEYNANQWYVGCQDTAAWVMREWGREVAYCHETQNQTDRLFERCLVDQGVHFDDRYLYAAPKE